MHLEGALKQLGPGGRLGRAFHGILQGFRLIPGGRILAGAGSELRVTLLNCFVMGIIEDSLDAIISSPQRLDPGGQHLRA